MIRLLETDEEKELIIPVIDSRDTFQYKPIDPKFKTRIVENTLFDCYVPGAEVYGNFDVYDQLNAFLIFHKWWNYEEKIYSMNLFCSKAGQEYPKTYDGVIPDIRIDMINYAVASFEERGYNTLYYMTVDDDNIKLPQDNLHCVLSNYNVSLFKYVEIGEHYPKGLEPTKAALAVQWKRENPLSYLVQWPLSQRQKIFKMTKVEK